MQIHRPRMVLRWCTPFVLTALCCVFGSAPRVTAEELPEAQWKEVTRGLDRLMRGPDKLDEKRDRIEALATDNSVRGMELLVKWTLASAKLREGRLFKAMHSTAKKYTDYRDKLLKKTRGDLQSASDRALKSLTKRREEAEAAQKTWRHESHVDRALADALARVRDPAAWGWMFEAGLASLRLGEYQGLAYKPMLEAATRMPTASAKTAIMDLIRGPTPPLAQVLALRWVGDLPAEKRPAHAVAIVCRALEARPVAVRRTAVWALTIFDDAEALPALIAASAKADGLLAAEIDRLLHSWTGVSMGGEGDLWAQWWAENEPTWKPTTKRHESLQTLLREEDVEFYGIRSPSKRVVFVVDASGSMNKSAKGVHATTGKPRPGPTRWEAAQDELVRAIKGLAHDARFNIVMYGDEPETYRAPKELILATREAKAAAIEWVEAYEAEGTTALFPALRQGLAYRDDFAGDAAYGDPGVDTIFLLTDGTPTDSNGDDLDELTIEAQLRRFDEENEVHQVIVHAIGVGRGHNRKLMQRIATTTGGKYVAVANN